MKHSAVPQEQLRTRQNIVFVLFFVPAGSVWVEDHYEDGLNRGKYTLITSLSAQKPLQVTGSVPAAANERPWVALIMSTSSNCLHKTRFPLSPVRARWSQSAGWTGLGSSWGTGPSFRCRCGSPTWGEACSRAPRNAWAINSSTSSSARSEPVCAQSKAEWSECETEWRGICGDQERGD